MYNTVYVCSSFVLTYVVDRDERESEGRGLKADHSLRRLCASCYGAVDASLACVFLSRFFASSVFACVAPSVAV